MQLTDTQILVLQLFELFCCGSFLAVTHFLWPTLSRKVAKQNSSVDHKITHPDLKVLCLSLVCADRLK